ncbi:hypothetical protein B0H19DRAFT_1227716 [Mycena capillaripes]|nr:hypothetical protein B0H19DRAFT_1227716 [Mycena capillaripes]
MVGLIIATVKIIGVETFLGNFMSWEMDAGNSTYRQINWASDFLVNASKLSTMTKARLGMHTAHQIAMTPNVVVFMGSRKLLAAEEALTTFSSSIHSSSAVVPVQLDITDETSIKNAHAFIVEDLKARNISGLDVLINNAASSSSSFKDTYEVNVFGTVAVTEAMRPLMNNGGAILNISSRGGSISILLKDPRLSMPSWHAYSSSKSALNNLTVHWALREKKNESGIRVVSICPGYNATKLNNYTGTMSPAEGCKIIVQTALEKEGRTGVFFSKDGDAPW